jgi:thiosulfate dehydrogenase (quinone) large subunit
MDRRHQSPSRKPASRRQLPEAGRGGRDTGSPATGRPPGRDDQPAGSSPGWDGSSRRRGRALDEQGEASGKLAARLSLAILPLRIFVGATFLYAGLDKLVDPTFLRDSGAGSIGLQLSSYTHVSPLAPLIQVFALPAPVLVGLLIALAEVAIGLGTLLGLARRWLAIGGFCLSILFWLTASWAAHPFYYGADLPYAFGWLTLAMAGNVGWSVESRLFGPSGSPWQGPDTDPGRRRLLQAGAQLGVVGVMATVLGGFTWLASSLFGRGARGGGTDTGSALPTGSGGSGGIAVAGAGQSPIAGSSTPGSTPAPTAGLPTPIPIVASRPIPPAGVGPVVGQLKDLAKGAALAIVDPASGDPAVLVRLTDGRVVCYDAVCTHAGCTVEFDQPSELLFCPCHGAVFDPAHEARVLDGPTRTPLTMLAVTLDPSTGAIHIAG